MKYVAALLTGGTISTIESPEYDLQLQPESHTLDLSLFWQSPTYPDKDERVEIRPSQADQIRPDWLAYPINGRYPNLE